MPSSELGKAKPMRFADIGVLGFKIIFVFDFFF
jgi:hypothetical protein